MAVSGSGGWIPSNWVRLRNGRIEFVGGYTQNKPPDLIPPVEEAARRLVRGERVTVDVRGPYMRDLRRAIEELRYERV